MMKKSLTQAIALATVLGAAASAHAVNVDQDGHGSVLLYPAYTVENDNATFISVVNTTDEYKAVKVRFVEGMNSKEVLDFNLYLSPNDVWGGAVVATAGGAKLVSNDTSCISAFANGFPAGGVAFRNTLLTDAPAGLTGLDRTRLGHIEVIEMGNIDPALVLEGTVTAGQAIKHVNGTPGNCAAINRAWNPGGVWKAANNAGITAGTGGLYGTGAIVNVNAGWASTYDATALANFNATTALHAEPGFTTPSLGQALPTSTFKEGTTAAPASGTGFDAVSAILMKEEIQNDYLIGSGLGAQTDMIITFPTKRQYVNVVPAGGLGPVAGGGTNGLHDFTAPFTAGWDMKTATACEEVGVIYYDTEEGEEALTDDQISPAPVVPGFNLCHETNIVHVEGSNLFGGGLYTGHDFDLAAGFDQGWINYDFRAAGRVIDMGLGLGNNPAGLPVIGFSTITTNNGDVGGLLSNYGQSFAHKATTTIE